MKTSKILSRNMKAILSGGIKRCALACFSIVFLAGCASSGSLTRSRNIDSMTDKQVADWVMSAMDNAISICLDDGCDIAFDPGTAVDTVLIDRGARRVSVEFNAAMAQRAFRPGDEPAIQGIVYRATGGGLSDWQVALRALDMPISVLVPNAFAQEGGNPAKRWPSATQGRPLTTSLDQPWKADALLSGRHIAVWPSHGWYYEERLDRWEWQRARLFQTVEDLLPMSFIVPYLTPMLENAGAYVHMPRERDVQKQEVVIDGDVPPMDGSRYLEIGELSYAWKEGAQAGFAPLNVLRDENPFRQGTYRISRTDSIASASISWTPLIPEDGEYAVYVSWGQEENATSDARYTVHHAGGSSSISVDQGMMAQTWVYVGTWRFNAGVDPAKAQVELTNESWDIGKVVSADAVRFGGGMGSVERNGQVSGRPRFTEGARYWMQYAGLPAAMVYNVTESSNDYIDDYRSRAEWVNYLRGAPLGPNKNRSEKGLGVPIDLSLAFHTDAGVTGTEETIGTLMIYSSTGTEGEREFPSGFSRFASRDLGDLMQTTIVSDIRAKYDSTWTRRAIWDRDYSESVRPNVPGVLLELLSHQNFADMRFALDPRFRFDVARSVYKSMVHFLADQNGFDPVIQPLAPDHLAAQWDGEDIVLTWASVEDPLEESATPQGYVVYTRTPDGGYDSGQFVSTNRFVSEKAPAGAVHAFRVSAVNSGGESFPSETVAAGRPSGTGRDIDALIVAGFDRVSAPGSVNYGAFRGFAGFVDEGVPDRYDLSFIGEQYDFNSDSPWLDDDSPGHGASWSTWETHVQAGNTFDYPISHGEALLATGVRFSTMSDEALLERGSIEADMIDLILGEEKRTEGPGRLDQFEAIPTPLQVLLRAFSTAGGDLLITGAHVATDLAGPQADNTGRSFAADVLGMQWRTDRAAQRGDVHVLSAFVPEEPSFSFNTGLSPLIYRVEHPDAMDPVSSGESLIRYSDNNMSAAVGVPGRSVVMGFPFETVSSDSIRALLMGAILDYLNQP